MEKLPLNQLRGQNQPCVVWFMGSSHETWDFEPWRVEVVVRLVLDCGKSWRESPQELETVLKFISSFRYGFSFVGSQILGLSEGNDATLFIFGSTSKLCKFNHYAWVGSWDFPRISIFPTGSTVSQSEIKILLTSGLTNTTHPLTRKRCWV